MYNIYLIAGKTCRELYFASFLWRRDLYYPPASDLTPQDNFFFFETKILRAREEDDCVLVRFELIATRLSPAIGSISSSRAQSFTIYATEQGGWCSWNSLRTKEAIR